MTDYIKNHTTEDETISVYGNMSCFYNMSERFSPSVYFFLPGDDPDSTDRYYQTFLDDYYRSLSADNPKLMIIFRVPSARLSQFFCDYHYADIIQFGRYHIFEKLY